MNTSTDLGCHECGQPYPFYTANCTGCEERAMACFVESHAAFLERIAKEAEEHEQGDGKWVGTPKIIAGLAVCCLGVWVVAAGLVTVYSQLGAGVLMVRHWIGV